MRKLCKIIECTKENKQASEGKATMGNYDLEPNTNAVTFNAAMNVYDVTKL